MRTKNSTTGMTTRQVKNDLKINSEEPKMFKFKSLRKQSNEMNDSVDWPN